MNIKLPIFNSFYTFFKVALYLSFFTFGLSVQIFGQSDKNLNQLWSAEPFGKNDISKELVERRSANEKHFQRADGQVDMLVSSDPINYFESGVWNTIYNTIREESNDQYKFSNYHNVFKSYYAGNIQDGFKTRINNQEIFEMLSASMYYEKNGEKLYQQPISASFGKADQNTLTYCRVYGDLIDLKVTQSGGKRKLDYIIKSKNALDPQFSDADYLVFSEEIVLPDGWSAKLENGSVLLIDQAGKVVSLYESPLVFDSNQSAPDKEIRNDEGINTSNSYTVDRIRKNHADVLVDNDIHYEIQLNGNKLVILTKVMVSYLLDENRVFPVVVDPTLTAPAAVTGLYYTNGTTGAGNLNSTGAPANSSITNTNISLSENSLAYRYSCGVLGLSTCWQSFTGNCGSWHSYQLTDVSSGKLINTCGGNTNYFNCSNPNRTWRIDIYSVDGYVYRGKFGYTLTITYETLAPNITPGTTNVCVGFDPPTIIPTGLGVTNMASVGLYDSDGDGWSGGNINISVAGVPMYTSFTLPNGFGPLYLNFPATSGQNVSVTYTSGSWCGENTYRLYRGGEGTSTLFFSSGTCPTGTYSTTTFGTIGNQYQWNLNGVAIGGATAASYDPPILSTPGTYSYTVTVTDACGLTVTSAARVYVVNPQNTIAAGQNRTVCQGSAMTAISLATTGATGATITGLPAGVTGSWAGNVVTISGTPTVSGTFNYTVTTTGGCPPATTTGTVTVTSPSVAPISISGGGTYCHGVPITLSQVGGVLGSGASFEWFSGTCGGTSAGSGASITPTPSGGTTTYLVRVAANGGCPASACVSTTVTLPTAGTVLSTSGQNATCAVSGNNWIRFYESGSGNFIGAINPNNNLTSNVTMTSYVGSASSMDACAQPGNVLYRTAYMGRNWVITSSAVPTGAVSVLLPFTDGEMTGLTTAAGGTGSPTGGTLSSGNPNDNIDNAAGLRITKYSNPGSENGTPTDNCSAGSSIVINNSSSGNLTSAPHNYGIASAQYAIFPVSGFSEFYLHGLNNNSPLPVELISFSGTCTDKGTELTWQTASESNNDYFIVQRSRDGQNWEDLTTVSGNGNSTHLINYDWLVDAGFGGMYYRLTQVDFNGDRYEKLPIFVHCNVGKTSMQVYPNPTSSHFTVEINSDINYQSASISIIDLTGKTLIQRPIHVLPGSNQFHFDDQVAIGSYLIQIQLDDTFQTLRFMVK